jgi:hypothetical protein
MKLLLDFSQRTHMSHSIGPKTHVLEHFGPFRYCTKEDAKLAELVLLRHKFSKQSRVINCRNERTRSTPLDQKLMFWGVSDRFVTARKSMQKRPNRCHYRTSSLNKVVSEFFATNAPDPLHWTKTHVLWRFGPFRYCMKVDAKLAELVPQSHKFAKESRVGIFSQRTHPIHSIEPKTHVLRRFGPFRYVMKVDAKLAVLVPLSHTFAKQSRIRIFRNERTRSTPSDQKLMFWGISDRFVTA